MCCIKTCMKDISLRAFSSITLGSSEVQRKQFGANTMARFDESILVQLTTSGLENCCKKCIKYVRTCRVRFEKNMSIFKESFKLFSTHQLINLGQLINYFFGFIGILSIHAILVIIIGYKRIVQFTIPQLKQTSGRMCIDCGN